MNKITLEFTEQEMSIINAALMELPYRMSAPILQSINYQITKKSEPQEKETESDNRSNSL